MSEQGSDLVEGHALLRQVASEGVPQHVRRHLLPTLLGDREAAAQRLLEPVSIRFGGAVVASYRRGTPERILIDPTCYEGAATREALPPPPLASVFFRLISYRYGRGSTILTTNKAVKDWPEILAGDEVMATAMLDRLLHKAHVLSVRGSSYRLRDLEKRLP